MSDGVVIAVGAILALGLAAVITILLGLREQRRLPPAPPSSHPGY